MRKSLLVIGILLAAILLAACGGSGGGEGDSADIEAGKELFNQTVIGENAGCVTCHSLEPDVVIVGPSLAHFGEEAVDEGADYGMTGEEFVRQSILDPNAVLAADFPPDTMPTNWGDVLTDEQIDNLVAFIMSLE